MTTPPPYDPNQGQYTQQPQYAQPQQYAAAPPAQGYGNQGPLGTPRKAVTVALLSIITLGIYWWVYCYKTSEEIKLHSGIGVGGAVQLILAIFTGFVPPFLIANDVKAMREAGGMQSPVSAMTAFWLLIPIAGIFIYLGKVQGALNEYWVSRGAQPV